MKYVGGFTRILVVLLTPFLALAQNYEGAEKRSGPRQINGTKTIAPPQGSRLEIIENKGQFPKEALYKIALPYGAMFVTQDGFMYNHFSQEEFDRLAKIDHDGKVDVSDEMLSFHAYRVSFVNANTKATSIKEGQHKHYYNFYLGNDPQKWASDVKLYEKVTQENIYPRTNIAVYQEKKSIKYDFIVYPGGNPQDIQMKFEGVKPALTKHGDLRITTSVNEVIEKAPYTYQIINGQKVEVPSKYVVNEGQVGFDFPDGYDSTHALIIDPVLVFATYSGGRGAANYAYSTTYDKVGNMYVGAYAYGTGWPVGTGSYQERFGGMEDVAINKYNPTGRDLIFSTFLGGISVEIAHALNVNKNNELVVAGVTQSRDFPVSTNAYKNTMNGVNDLFVTHFNADGTALIGSTYIGGSSSDGMTFDLNSNLNPMSRNQNTTSPIEIAFDKNNNIWAVSNTISNNFPITPNIVKNTYTKYAEICPGGTYQLGTQNLTSPGIYTESFSSAGCDSAVILHLSYYNPGPTMVDHYLCDGDSLRFGEKYITRAGQYIDTFTYSSSERAGCDSIVWLTLHVKNRSVNTVLDTICAGDTYWYNNKLITTSGTYIDTFQGVYCDSVVLLGLHIRSLQIDTVQGSFCAGKNYYFGGRTLTTAGVYRDTIVDITGCKKVIVLQLKQASQLNYVTFINACPGESIVIDGNTYTSDTSFETRYATSGCDSVVLRHLAFKNYSRVQKEVYICEGDSYNWNGIPINSAGTYVDTFTSATGCDSIVTINLMINPKDYYAYNVVLCQDEPYRFGDTTITMPGIYTKSFKTRGCDSVVTLTFRYEEYKIYSFNESYCENSRYYFGNRVLTAVGAYRDTFYSVNGCRDSVVLLRLSSPWKGSDSLKGGADGVIFKLDPNCSNLLFSKYIGGTGHDALQGLIFNNAGNLVISGTTASTDFPTSTANVINPNPLGGNLDGIVMIINPEYGTVIHSTYLGTAENDGAVMVQVNEEDNVYVLGRTLGNYPINAGYVPNPNGDIFVEVLDPDLQQSIMSTRAGNAQTEGRFYPTSFLVDICENIYIAGLASTANKPLTPDAYERERRDFWFGALSPNMGELLFGSYFGTTSDHNHVGIGRFDPAGIVYQSVCCNLDKYPGVDNDVWGNGKQNTGQDIISFKFNFEISGVVANFELDPDVSNNDTGCAPYPVRLINTSTAGVNFIWDFGDGTTSTAMNPSHIYNNPGTYKLSLYSSNPGACIEHDTAYMTITVLKVEKPDLFIGDTLIICEFQDSVNISVTVRNPTQYNTFEWQPTTGIIGANNRSEIIVNPFLNDTYAVIVKDTIPGICGITSVDTVHINVVPRQLRILNNDTAVCKGTIVPITAEGNYEYTYSWSPTLGVNEPSNPNAIIQATETVTYTLTASYPGCQDTTASIRFDVHEFPWISLGEDKFVCYGSEVDLEAIVQPYRPDYKFQWLPENSGLKYYDKPNTSFIADSNMTFILLSETPIGCGGGDTINIYVHPNVVGTVTPDTGFCPGDEVQLLASGGDSYQWLPEEGLNNPNIANPVARPLKSTTYKVAVLDAYGCSDTVAVHVDVYPAAIITMPDSVNIYGGERLKLDLETNCTQFEWYPPSGIDDVFSSNPTFYPEVRTRYFVKGTTILGCEVLDSVDILPQATVIDMPNAFSPNGANATFKIVKRGIAKLHSFQVYNRWGAKLFETTNVEEGWDGTQDGVAQPLGVYVYRIEATTNEGKHFVQNGNVTLMR